jgi:lysophospholipase L1-like esterase
MSPSDRTAGAARPRRLGHKLALGVGATLVGLVLAELILQLAGAVVSRTYERGDRVAGDADAITILCVGDSHTFGLPLPEQDAYPAQLEGALQAAYPEQRFRVVNLGIPGLNSTFVANRLERQIFQLRPGLVIVWVGINNLWNAVERQAGSATDDPLRWRRPLMRSRLFRLASIAWFNATGHQYDAEGRGGWYEGELPPSGSVADGVEMPDPAPGLARDLTRMVELTRSVDTPILFVAYPMAGQRAISRVIVATAGRLGVGVIETKHDLERARADGHRQPALIDRRSGPHPSGLLYRYIVESMRPVVASTLSTWHGIPLEATP